MKRKFKSFEKFEPFKTFNEAYVHIGTKDKQSEH